MRVDGPITKITGRINSIQLQSTQLTNILNTHHHR